LRKPVRLSKPWPGKTARCVAAAGLSWRCR
jgi:hypothetical protein